MIRHLFKLMWNRKRKNFLMMMEIFISFVVLFIALSVLIFNINNYLQPLGFSYKDVWMITLDWKDTDKTEVVETLKQMNNTLDSYSEVEYHSLSKSYIFMPYTSSNDEFVYNNNEVVFERFQGGDDFDNVLDIKTLEGRWFNESDNAYNKTPVVINRKAETEMFKEEGGLGKTFANTRDENGEKFFVIGIIDDFRNTGQFSKTKNVMFRRINLNDEIDKIDYVRDSMLNRLLLKIKSGTDAGFEERMMKQLSGIAKNFNLKVQRADDTRKFANKSMIILPLILLIITSFLVINVALGLFGIIWYNINKRKSEIGLRRALGSPANTIYLQILGESIVLSTFGIVLGLIIAIQFPILNLIGFIDVGIYYVSIITSIISIYLVTSICALYPAKLASDIQPAIALHYD